MRRQESLSIGEVLVELKPEFPDVTISKIRFLESEGLINPERTKSGYRKFHQSDVERLRMILKLQRDEFLPLKVIKERMEMPSGTVAVRQTSADADDEVAMPTTDVQMSANELASATGVDADMITELESFGLLTPRSVNGSSFYDADDLAIVGVVKEFLRYGLEPRHLTMYRHFAQREASLFQAIVLPVLRQRNPEARRTAADSLTELSRISRRLKQALLRANLRPHFPS